MFRPRRSWQWRLCSKWLRRWGQNHFVINIKKKKNLQLSEHLIVFLDMYYDLYVTKGTKIMFLCLCFEIKFSLCLTTLCQCEYEYVMWERYNIWDYNFCYARNMWRLINWCFEYFSWYHYLIFLIKIRVMLTGATGAMVKHKKKKFLP